MSKKKERVTPDYKKVEGTNCVVDAFTYQSPTHSAYFLSHYHSDHYTGLRASYKRPAPIYASDITVKLVISKLNVKPEHIITLPMNQEIEIPQETDVTVTLLDANHCPGAVLFLFRVGSQYHLHTGDMRYHPKMKLYKELQGISIHNLYLDTTYCNSNYSFPEQEIAIQSAMDIMRREKNPKTLFVVGSYTIGKEKIFLQAAKEFKCKVFALPHKYQILRHVGVEAELLTTNPSETFIHVAPMKVLSYKGIIDLYGKFRHKYSRIVGFKPTGWSLGKKPFTKYGPHTVYSIPYSEHSSVTELREFVQWIEPKAILPTVNGGNPAKVASMIAELKRKPKEDVAKSISIFSFFSRSSGPSTQDIKVKEEQVQEEVTTTEIKNEAFLEADVEEVCSEGEGELDDLDFDVDNVDLMFMCQQRWIERCLEMEKQAGISSQPQPVPHAPVSDSNINSLSGKKRKIQSKTPATKRRKTVTQVKLPSFFSKIRRSTIN